MSPPARPPTSPPSLPPGPWTPRMDPFGNVTSLIDADGLAVLDARQNSDTCWIDVTPAALAAIRFLPLLLKAARKVREGSIAGEIVESSRSATARAALLGLSVALGRIEDEMPPTPED